MKRLVCCVVTAGFINGVAASAQSWPDYHLTNGTHYTSYGVELYDPVNPFKNLYIDPIAILRAGSTELNNIHDSNQVYLNGGTVYASEIDAADFTWNSGSLHLDGGIHSTAYGFGSGTGKDLWLERGATLNQTSMNALPVGNQLFLDWGSKLVVDGDFDASMEGFYAGGATLEVRGSLLGITSLGGSYSEGGVAQIWDDIYGIDLVLNGPSARWDVGASSIKLPFYNSLSVINGATMVSASGRIGGNYDGNSSVEISGTGSSWLLSGSLGIGLSEGFNNRLVITNGGFVSSGSAIIGSEYGGGNVVKVSGAGSKWINAGALVVGSERAGGNKLLIDDGGEVFSSVGYIGTGERNTHGNIGEVSGQGSLWNISGGLTIGHGGMNNRLMISGGGVVSNSVGRIGISDGGSLASGSSATVTGAGSMWNNSASLTIGVASPDTRMIISEGGVVNNTDSYIGRDQTYPGDGTGSVDGNSVVVSGVDSKWNNSGTLTIGHALNTRNTLTVTNGGEVVAQGGVMINGSGNLLNLDRDGRLTIGTNFDASMSGFNFNSGSTLAVEGQLSGLSSLETGLRLETASVLGDMMVHGVFAPGNSAADSIVEGTLTLAPDGTLEMELGGYLLGKEHDRLMATETVYLDGILDIVLLDDFSAAYGDTFDLFNWDGGVIGEFESISTSALTGNLEWDTSDLYNSGTLSVIPEPGVISLMAVFGGGLWVIRRFFPSV